MLIKICGLTDKKEVEYLKESKADFAGMVLFYEKSKRNITVEQAKLIIKELRPDIKAVAVTVAPTKEQINEIETAGFDYLQVHGKIDDELIENCKIPILKAFNVDDLLLYEHYVNLNNISGFVFDAGEPGSGKTFDWETLKGLKRQQGKMYILAGGLNAENVGRAIQVVNPDGVDISSGVEFTDRPGKDPAKISEFTKQVRLYS